MSLPLVNTGKHDGAHLMLNMGEKVVFRLKKRRAMV
jgi:hypothetical protein